MSLAELAAQGKTFAQHLKESLSLFSADERFKVIMSVGEMECAVRFHKSRAGEDWLAPDLNKYEEAVLVLET